MLDVRSDFLTRLAVGYWEMLREWGDLSRKTLRETQKPRLNPRFHFHLPLLNIFSFSFSEARLASQT